MSLLIHGARGLAFVTAGRGFPAGNDSLLVNRREAQMPRTSRRSGTTLLFTAIMVIAIGLMSAAVFSVASASSQVSFGRVKRGRLRGYAENGAANAYLQL